MIFNLRHATAGRRLLSAASSSPLGSLYVNDLQGLRWASHLKEKVFSVGCHHDDLDPGRGKTYFHDDSYNHASPSHETTQISRPEWELRLSSIPLSNPHCHSPHALPSYKPALPHQYKAHRARLTVLHITNPPLRSDQVTNSTWGGPRQGWGRNTVIV